MEEWGYDFPETWNVEEVEGSWKYDFVNVFRKIYWRYLR
jgi:hypothetical protein